MLTPRARFTFEAGELTLEAIAEGFDEADAVEGIGWQVPRARSLRRLAPIPPQRAATAAALLKLWGREAI